MRTGPFSSRPVIDRLNAAVVPVYAGTAADRAGGAAPDGERAEYDRVYREALAKNFSAGTVHVYVLSPGGDVVGTRHVVDAAKTQDLIAFLDEVVARLGTQAGRPLVPPKAQ